MKKLLTIITVLNLVFFLSALDIPQMDGAVVDNANVLTSSQEKEIEEYLNSVNDQTTVQVGVLTIKSLNNSDIETYSMRVAEQWALGQKDKDNGALLLVAVNDRKLRIEVGYGLEGLLTDAKCGLIIRKVITPEFQTGDYAEGIYKGVRNIVGIATNNTEIISSALTDPSSEESTEAISSILGGIIFLIVFILTLSSRFLHGGRRRGGILGDLILLNMLGKGHRGGSSGFKSGGFGGGGGFHGGGGGFGGGGASGGW